MKNFNILYEQIKANYQHDDNVIEEGKIGKLLAGSLAAISLLTGCGEINDTINQLKGESPKVARDISSYLTEYQTKSKQLYNQMLNIQESLKKELSEYSKLEDKKEANLKAIDAINKHIDLLIENNEQISDLRSKIFVVTSHQSESISQRGQALDNQLSDIIDQNLAEIKQLRKVVADLITKTY